MSKLKNEEFHENFASDVKRNVQYGETLLVYFNGIWLRKYQVKTCSEQIEQFKKSITKVEVSLEDDKKELANAYEALRQAKDRLEKVRRPSLFGAIDERRVREKELTLQVEQERLDQAVRN